MPASVVATRPHRTLKISQKLRSVIYSLNRVGVGLLHWFGIAAVGVIKAASPSAAILGAAHEGVGISQRI